MAWSSAGSAIKLPPDVTKTFVPRSGCHKVSPRGEILLAPASHRVKQGSRVEPHRIRGGQASLPGSRLTGTAGSLVGHIIGVERDADHLGGMHRRSDSFVKPDVFAQRRNA